MTIKSFFITTPWGKLHTLESGTAEQSIIFLHGWNNDAWSARKVIIELSQTYRVIVPTLPGSHPSMSLQGRISPQKISAILSNWFEQVAPNTPIVIGHSFGGFCAMLLANEKKRYIKKVVICNAAGIPIERKSGDWVRSWIRHRPALYRKYGFSIVRMLDRSLLKQCTFRYKDFFQTAMIAKQIDIRQLVPSLQVPLIIAWGNSDELMLGSQANALHKAYPNSRLVTFPGDHYWPVLEPQRFFSLLA